MSKTHQMSTTSERRRWDEKHSAKEGPGDPTPFLVSSIKQLPPGPPGRCLDLAAGRGGNALFMAAQGYRVDAVDWSLAGLRHAQKEAARRELMVKLVLADLTKFPLPRERYDVVLCFRYLDRNLWGDMVRALKPGGALLLETFTEEHQTRPDFPREFCLAPGELLKAFPQLRVAIYREAPGEGTASLLAFRWPLPGAINQVAPRRARQTIGHQQPHPSFAKESARRGLNKKS